MDKPSKIDRMIDRMEERHLEHYHKKIDLIKKIKAYLEEEVRANQSLQNLQATCEEACGHDLETDQIHIGRAECAEGLLNQIKTWENENVTK